MENNIIFRDISRNDVDQLYGLLNGLSSQAKFFFHPHPFEKKALTQICNGKKDHYFVIAIGKKIIGYSFLRLLGYKIPSYGGCIHNDFQNQGFGTKLADLTINKAKEFGYKKVILKVYKNNKFAFNTYKTIGFKIVEDLKDTNEWKMEINL